MKNSISICAVNFSSLWQIVALLALVIGIPRSLNAETATASATFAGGCFWCMEKPFDELDGVLRTTSGYTGGELANPSYEDVASGRTGHIEAVQIDFYPARVSYGELLDVFWRNIDPLDDGGQFCDRGHQYSSAIFYASETQKELALESKRSISTRFSDSIATRVLPLSSFYAAEEYHQDYYDKNPIRYKFYRFNCGRDRRLDQLWEE